MHCPQLPNSHALPKQIFLLLLSSLASPLWVRHQPNPHKTSQGERSKGKVNKGEKNQNCLRVQKQLMVQELKEGKEHKGQSINNRQTGKWRETQRKAPRCAYYLLQSSRDEKMETVARTPPPPHTFSCCQRHNTMLDGSLVLTQRVFPMFEWSFIRGILGHREIQGKSCDRFYRDLLHNLILH